MKDIEHYKNLLSNSQFDDKPLGIPFRYEGHNQSRLKSILQEDFEEIIEDSDAWKTAVNLMKWISSAITHNGQVIEQPRSNYAECIIDFGQKNGANCFHLSVALSELYMMAGLKAKFVYCLPKDEYDGDCHVVVHVFIPCFNQWVLMDPTYNLFYMDAAGKHLSIPELKNSIISDSHINLNPDRKPVDIGFLKTYMAKNLYWFGYYHEMKTAVSDDYLANMIWLAPLGFDACNREKINLEYRERYLQEHPISKEANTLLMNYYQKRRDSLKQFKLTNNYNAFWID